MHTIKTPHMGITVEEMKMKLKKFAALLLAAVMTLSMAACTKEEGQSNDGGSKGSEEKDQLVLGTSADFAPYEFHKMVNGKDTILGFDVALAKKIAEEMDKELVIKDMDFNSLLNELNNGTVDFVAAGLSPDEERKKQVDFSDPYYFGEQCCIIRKEDAEKYTSLESFKDQQIAAQTGSIQEGIAKEQFPGSVLVSLPKLPDEIMSLSSGKVEGVIVEVAVAKGFIAQNPDLMIADFKVPYDATGSCIAVKKGNTELLDHINSVIADVTSSGEMDEMVNQANLDSEY